VHPGKTLRILIAEDDPTSLRVLETFLGRWGYEVVSARDGIEAWELLERPDAPRLVVLDWMMPGMEGLEIVRRLREAEEDSGEHSARYLIMLTAKGSREDTLEGLRAGVDDYVSKPFDKDELKARLSVGARMVSLQAKLAERVFELEAALGQVKALRGLLPICSYCKKIRDDRNYWTEVESYVERHSHAEFSHGVCPDCYQEHLKPDLDEMRRQPPSSTGS
jgi:CheY-like chemotaxis protein